MDEPNFAFRLTWSALYENKAVVEDLKFDCQAEDVLDAINQLLHAHRFYEGRVYRVDGLKIGEASGGT